MRLNKAFPSSAWLWGGFVCLVVTLGIRLYLVQDRQAGHVQAQPATAALFPDPASAAFAFVGPRTADQLQRVISDTLQRSDTMAQSLRQHGLPEAQVVQLVTALGAVHNCRSGLRPGDVYSLTLDPTGQVQQFTFVPYREPERPVVVEPVGGRLVGRCVVQPLTVRTQVLELRLQSNLYNAVKAAGESEELTDLLADDILGSVVDFQHDPRVGDRIGLVYEKLYRDDRFIRYGKVLAAHYDGKTVNQLAVFYDGPAGSAGYYDGEGKSLERSFLLYALPYRGITSRFSYQRFHPVLQRTAPHLGTDYAASTGTQVWATARGRVVHAGWKGAYGNAVIIEHANGFQTCYGHLSRVLVNRGEFVQQKTLIGLVGTTGRTTGPHLHYEIIKDGRHLNPENVNKGARGRPLDASQLAGFSARRDSLVTLLRDSAGHGQELASAVPATDDAVRQ